MPASISTYRKAVLVGRESTPGTPETLTAADQGVRDFREMKLDSDIKRIETANLAKTTFGPSPAQFDSEASFYKLALTQPVRAVANAGDLPDLSELFFACGLAETVNEGVSVIYAPQTPDDPNTAQSASIEVYKAGKKHGLHGARGTFTLIGKPGEVLQMKFELSAPYLLPTADITVPTVSKPTGSPLTFSGAVAITKDTVEIDIGEFEFSLEAKIELETSSTGATVYLTDIVPTLKIDPLAVANAVEWDRLVNAATVAFNADFGSGKMVLDIPNANLVEMTTDERSKRTTRKQSWECLETVADDQFSLLFKK